MTIENIVVRNTFLSRTPIAQEIASNLKVSSQERK
jgi:hypothetical protein